MTPHRGRLIAPRRRSRPRWRTAVAAAAGIAVLLAALGGAAALALEQSTAAPAASISPTPSGPPSPEPTPGVVASSETSFTAVIDEQDVRLELPGGDVSGVAVFFPGSADVPANALTSPWALALLDAGWAVATSDFHGASWGSPSSSADLQALLAWTSSLTDATARLFVSHGMGATTSLAAMARRPAAPIPCWYSAAPVVDLVSQVETDPAVQDQILDAWGRVPGTQEAPLAVVDTLPTETAYRVAAPPAGAPALLVQDSATLVASLESSGHAVTTATLTADDPLTTDDAVALDPADLLGFAEGCDA